jgi:hypothetical protein
MDTAQQAKTNSSAVLADGSTVSITQLLTGGGEPRRVDEPAPKFYRCATNAAGCLAAGSSGLKELALMFLVRAFLWERGRDVM